MFEGKISNHTIRNNELEKKMTILVKRDEEANLTDKLLNDTNKELKRFVPLPILNLVGLLFVDNRNSFNLCYSFIDKVVFSLTIVKL